MPDFAAARKRLFEVRLPDVQAGTDTLRRAIEWERQLAAGEVRSRADIARREGLSRARVTQILGRRQGQTFRGGKPHVVTFFDRPRLYRIAGGVLEREWPEIHTGNETSSIRGYSPTPLPPIALDPKGQRFAVANGTTIHPVQISIDT